MSDLATLTPSQLAWLRFKRHRLAVLSGVFLLAIYGAAFICELIAPYGPNTRDALAINGPPMRVRFVDHEGQFHLRPFVYGRTMSIDEDTWQRQYTEDPSRRFDLHFFAKGEPYKFLGLIPLDRHLFAVVGHIHLFGTDQLGRDLFSRIFYGARVSLSIGLVGVAITLMLGLLLGGLFVVLTVMAFNLFGDGLRDAADPYNTGGE